MPITRGATSKAILAQIRGKRLDRLIDPMPAHETGDRDLLAMELEKIRRNGICTTRAEVDKSLMGSAVPVTNKALGIEASLSCIFDEADFLPEHEPKIFADLSTFAKLIENHMQSEIDEVDSPSDAGSPPG